MFNWKKKIDNFKESQKVIEEQKDLDEVSRLQQAREAAALVREGIILELGKKFKCHICLTPATKPFSSWCGGAQSNDGGPEAHEEEDLNLPGDLWKCNVCHEWTCEEDLYKGICQSCAEKL